MESLACSRAWCHIVCMSCRVIAFCHSVVVRLFVRNRIVAACLEPVIVAFLRCFAVRFMAYCVAKGRLSQPLSPPQAVLRTVETGRFRLF